MTWLLDEEKKAEKLEKMFRNGVDCEWLMFAYFFVCILRSLTFNPLDPKSIHGTCESTPQIFHSQEWFNVNLISRRINSSGVHLIPFLWKRNIPFYLIVNPHFHFPNTSHWARKTGSWETCGGWRFWVITFHYFFAVIYDLSSAH